MPPHLRHQSPATPNTDPIERNPEDGYTLEEIAHQFDCKHKVGTLNSNAELGREWDPSSLAFVVVFRGQHPEWPGKIFCKTNLNLLPGGGAVEGATNEDGDGGEQSASKAATEEEPSPLTPPIPIFTEGPRQNTNGGTQHLNQKFFFTGYHILTRTTYLAPGSPQLVKMLDTKFTPEGKRRSVEAWKHSLSLTCAVVELRGVEAEEAKEKGNPMVPLKEVKKRGVSEMLEAMRLGGEEGRVEEGGRGGRGGLGRGRGIRGNGIVGTRGGRASWGRVEGGAGGKENRVGILSVDGGGKGDGDGDGDGEK